MVLVCVTGHAAAGEDSQFVTGPDHAEHPRRHVKIVTYGKMGTSRPQFLYICCNLIKKNIVAVRVLCMNNKEIVVNGANCKS